MRALAIAVTVALTLSVASLWAQSTPPAPAPPGAGETKPASVAGAWALTVDLENPNASSTLEIKLEGKKVTGSIVGANTFEIVGEYAEGKLSFSIQYNPETTVRFVGQLKEDGTLSGTLEYGEGPVNWRAKRKG